MDPITAIALAGLAISAGGTLAKVLPDKAERDRRKKIEELTTLEKEGRLGLTDAQRAELQALGMSPVQALQREQRARAGETVGLAEVGSGGVLVRQEAQQEGIRQAARDVGLALTAADREAAQMQKQELESLKERQDVAREQRKQNVAAGIEDLAVGATQIAASTIQGKMEGLMKNDETALTKAINNALESGEAYVVGRGGAEQFSPEFANLLRQRGYSNQNISYLESVPRDVLRSQFLERAFTTPSTGTTFNFAPAGAYTLTGLRR